MMIYKTRYQAMKAKRTNPYYSSDDVIVKVYGGYVIMSAEQYYTYKAQK